MVQKLWSGRWDSHPRHPPWQGGILATELHPRIFEKELRTLPELDRLVVDYQSISLTVLVLLYVRMKLVAGVRFERTTHGLWAR